MRPRSPFFSAACVSLTVIAAGCNQPPATQAPSPAPASAPQSQVERGKLLVTIGGCHDCHTTKKLGPRGPEPDMSRMLAGHPEAIKITAPFQPAGGSPWTIATNDTFTAWSGPWGVSFTANLTPDRNTGTGEGGPWTEELFIKAMRTGKHIGTSRDILPPMPWFNYAEMSDDDLKAVWAFLRSIPAITNHVPDPIPPDVTATK